MRGSLFKNGATMRAVIQRVTRAVLTVAENYRAEIGRGLVVYLGVSPQDTQERAAAMAKKIAALRIFADEAGKMNRSVCESGGEVLLVSQFTLYGDCSHGNRPSFTGAARPELAAPLYESVAQRLSALGVPVRTGVFGADMHIEQGNDGPVTIVYEC